MNESGKLKGNMFMIGIKNKRTPKKIKKHLKKGRKKNKKHNIKCLVTPFLLVIE